MGNRPHGNRPGHLLVQAAAPVPSFEEETPETAPEICGVPPPPPAPPRAHGGRRRGILLEVNREADCLVGRLRDIETQQRIIGEVTKKGRVIRKNVWRLLDRIDLEKEYVGI